MSDNNPFNLVYRPNPHRTLPSEIGQWVMLNSGGPDMLVVDVCDNGELVCAWENESSINEYAFNPVCLRFVF